MRRFVIVATALNATELSCRIYSWVFGTHQGAPPLGVQVGSGVLLLTFALWGAYLLGEEATKWEKEREGA